jgi:hypothetical protein
MAPTACGCSPVRRRTALLVEKRTPPPTNAYGEIFAPENGKENPMPMAFLRQVGVNFLLPASLLFIVLLGTGNTAFAASSSHRPEFVWKLLSRHEDGPSATTSFAGKTWTMAFEVTPQDIEIPCLGVTMNMQNPQLDVIEVYTSVVNNCSIAVSSVELSWDTDVICNGGSTAGPSDTYYGNGSLAPTRSFRWSGDYSTICYGNTFPYYPVSYQIQGYAETSAYYSPTATAIGDTTTPTYTFT